LRQANDELERRQGWLKARDRAVRRLQAGEAPAAEPAGGPGATVSWAGSAERPPALTLVAQEQRWVLRALSNSVAVTAVLLAVWLLLLVPPLAWAARLLWPEEVVLLGALGWHLAGPTLLVLLLLAVGVMGRAVLLVVAARQLALRKGQGRSTNRLPAPSGG
jgi:hypothetical protein